jgi:hypothetical protein
MVELLGRFRSWPYPSIVRTFPFVYEYIYFACLIHFTGLREEESLVKQSYSLARSWSPGR